MSKKRHHRPAQFTKEPKLVLPDIDTALAQADALIRAGSSQAAVDLLQPLAAKHPHDADLQSILGFG